MPRYIIYTDKKSKDHSDIARHSICRKILKNGTCVGSANTLTFGP